MTCTCTVRPWFVGILHPEDEDNLVTYWNGCEIHTEKEAE